MSILDFLHSWVLAIAGISKPNGRGNAVSIAITDVLLVNWPQIIRDRPKVSRKPGFPLRRRPRGEKQQCPNLEARRATKVRMRGLHLLLICILTMASTLIPSQEAKPTHRRMDEVSSLARLVSALVWEELLEEEEDGGNFVQPSIERMLEERAGIFNGLHRRQSKMTKQLLNSRNYGVKGDLIPYPRTG